MEIGKGYICNKKKLMLYAILTIISFQIQLDYRYFHNAGKSLEFAHKYSIVYMALIPILYIFYYKIELIKKKSVKIEVLMPALFFAFSMIIGYSYDKTDSWDLVINTNIMQWIKVIIVLMGYSVFFYYVIFGIFYLLDNNNFFKQEYNITGIIARYAEAIRKRPFIVAFISLFIVYLPIAILSYPGIFMGDTPNQITQAFPELGIWGPNYLEKRHLKDDVFLNTHHPIAHTLLLHLCLVIGKTLFMNYNVGIFIFVLIQWLAMICTMALIIRFLLEHKVSVQIVLLVLAYFMFSPRIQSYMFLITKDIFLVIFLQLFLLYLCKVCEEKLSRWDWTMFICSMVGIFFFRNDGKYILMLSLFFFMIILKSLRKTMGILLMLCFCVSIIYNNLLLPEYNITSGSVREMLSIPFQQTARYLKYSSDSATEEEKEAISAVLDYENLVDIYDPERADNVKDTFNENATHEEIKKYFEVWYKMLKKHPSHYIQATINNYYYYFYPGTRLADNYTYQYSLEKMEIANRRCEKLQTDFRHPDELDNYRNKYEQIRENIWSMPVLSFLLLPATYSWALIVLLFYCIYKRNRYAICMTIPMLIQLLICLAGPCNGYYFRYLYPVAVCLPMVMLNCLYLINRKQSN